MAKIITNVKKFKLVRRVLAGLLIFAMSFGSFAAIVADNDASAFITKAEFQALKHSFDSQINGYLNTVDAKIDYTIANYLNNFSASAGVVTNYNLLQSQPVINGELVINDDGTDDPVSGEWHSSELSIWAPLSGSSKEGAIPLSTDITTGATVGAEPTWSPYVMPTSLTTVPALLYNFDDETVKQLDRPTVDTTKLDPANNTTYFVVKQKYNKETVGSDVAGWVDGLEWAPESRGALPNPAHKYGVWYTESVTGTSPNFAVEKVTDAAVTTTQGDVLISGATGIPKWLAGSNTKGTILYNSAANTPDWLTSPTKGQMLYASAANTPNWLSPPSAQRFLTSKSDGATTATYMPTWSSYSLPNGGTSTLTQYALLYNSSTTQVDQLAPKTTAGQYYLTNEPSSTTAVAPAWQSHGAVKSTDTKLVDGKTVYNWVANSIYKEYKQDDGLKVVPTSWTTTATKYTDGSYLRIWGRHMTLVLVLRNVTGAAQKLPKGEIAWGDITWPVSITCWAFGPCRTTGDATGQAGSSKCVGYINSSGTSTKLYTICEEDIYIQNNQYIEFTFSAVMTNWIWS